MRFRFAAVAGAVAINAPIASAQLCEPRWLTGWGRQGADGTVIAFGTFDFDGPGPGVEELVVGGQFSLIADAYGTGVARWDGARWLPVGSALVQAWDFAVFDPDGSGPHQGELIAAGRFYNPSGPFNRLTVLRWNGSEWQDLSPELSFRVHAVESFDPDGDGPIPSRLIAGGHVDWEGPAIAQWDGNQWLSLSTGIAGWPNQPPRVESMAVFDADGVGPQPGQLIVAGMFRQAGAVPVNSIASWDGGTWSALGSGLEDPDGSPAGAWGSAMCEVDVDGTGPIPARLFVGGNFRRAGGVESWSIAQWDGSGWSGAGGGVTRNNGSTPIPGYVLGMTAYDEDGPGSGTPVLVVAGSFDRAGGVESRNLASFDGTGWSSAVQAGLFYVSSPNGYPLPTAAFTPTGTDHPQLFIGGQISAQNGGLSWSIAVREATQWRTVGSGFDGFIHAIEAFDHDGPGPAGQEIFASGTFRSTPHGPANRFARYDGATWRAFGDGNYGSPRWLKRLDSDGPGPLPEELFASPIVIDGVARQLAAWDGQSWRTFGSFPAGMAIEIEVHDFDGSGPGLPQLVVVVYSGGAVGVWRWDGVAWNAVGYTFDLSWGKTHWLAEGRAIAVYDADGSGPARAELYVGGFFDRNGSGHMINHIARWDGVDWRPVGTGQPQIDGGVYELLPFDPDGTGSAPPMLAVSTPGRVFTWNGSTWGTLGGPVGAWTLAVFDPDGTGGSPEQLFARGEALSVWDGAQWVQLESIAGAMTVWRTSSLDPGQLVIGGGFSGVNGHASFAFARMTCTRECYANCDGSEGSPRLTANDFMCFMERFAAAAADADCDGSADLNAADFQCFLNAYTAGCP